MSKHTPGKWFISANRIRTDAPGAGYIDGVAHVMDVCRPDGNLEQSANVRLIAAAPELLEALKNARALLRGEMGQGFDVEMIDAAIEKAEGAS